MARPREVPGIDCEESFSLAAARVVEVRAGEVFEHAGGVLELDEVEPLHDMRVATRRLRAALEVFRPCFPRQRRKRALKKVKAAGKKGITTHARVSQAFHQSTHWDPGAWPEAKFMALVKAHYKTL